MTAQWSHHKRGHPAQTAVALAVAAALFLSGCVKIDVNVPDFGSDDAEDNGGSASDWKGTAINVASQMTLAAEHGTLFYAFDTLALPDKSVELLARVLSIRKMSAIKNASIEFSRGASRADIVQTDKDGYAKVKWKAKTPGDYEFSVKIVGVPSDELAEMKKVSAAPLLVCVRPKHARFAVVDLDHTLVTSSFARVLMGGARPMPRAAQVVKELAGTYSIIYLTHRPDLLSRKSKRWLTDNGFPRGPLLVSTLKQAFGDSGKYKTAKLRQLRKRHPGLEIGIGDKLSDADAYAANGMKAYLIPHYDRDDDEDVRELAERLRKLPGDVQVVDDWDQIRAGVLRKTRYTPRSYAKKLDDRAGALQRQKRRRENHDDDDD